MKKSTILVLLIVFLGSVLVVGIFGLRAVSYEKIVYVQEIRPTSVVTKSANAQELEIKIDPNGYYVLVPYEEGLEVLINYELTPADCTNKDIKITIVHPDKNPPAIITDRNTIVFTRKGAIHLQYSAQDSASGPTMDFWIYPYN